MKTYCRDCGEEMKVLASVYPPDIHMASERCIANLKARIAALEEGLRLVVVEWVRWATHSPMCALLRPYEFGEGYDAKCSCSYGETYTKVKQAHELLNRPAQGARRSGEEVQSESA